MISLSIQAVRAMAAGLWICYPALLLAMILLQFTATHLAACAPTDTSSQSHPVYKTPLYPTVLSMAARVVRLRTSHIDQNSGRCETSVAPTTPGSFRGIVTIPKCVPAKDAVTSCNNTEYLPWDTVDQALERMVVSIQRSGLTVTMASFTSRHESWVFSSKWRLSTASSVSGSTGAVIHGTTLVTKTSE